MSAPSEGESATDIAAGDRVHLTVRTPISERHDIGLVERTKALLGEWCWRTQFAGAERRQGSAGLPDELLDAREALRQRHRRVEPHALNGIPGKRRRTARVLKDSRDEAIASRENSTAPAMLQLPQKNTPFPRSCQYDG